MSQDQPSLTELLESALTAQNTGRWGDALEQFESALWRVAREGGPEDAADILRRLAVVHRVHGDQDAAIDLLEASLAIAELNGLDDRVASALINLANVHKVRGAVDLSEEYNLRARDIAESIGSERLVAMTEQNLGVIANIRGEVETALARYGAALERYQQLGDDTHALRVLNNVGMAHVDLHQWDAAETCFIRAVVLADRLQDARALGFIDINRAELYLRSGRLEMAREFCDRAFETFSRLEMGAGIAEVYKFYGLVYRETGKPRLADVHFRTAVSSARECQDRLLEAEALSEWALVHQAENRSREALQCLNTAHRIFGDLHASRDLLDLDRRLDSLEGTYLRVVREWAESIESKDRYTAGHCERVANYACMLAEAVGITGRDLTWLRMGGYLHDVGKIAVPLEVLNKAGKLTDEEWVLMKNHTVEGDAIVAELNFPWDIRPVVRWHHERWNGTGYPDRLKGEEIPLTARIMCVADVYDALTTARSYRAAMSQAEALRIMEGDAGSILDPELFSVFRELITGVVRTPTADLRFPVFGRMAAAVA